MQVKHFPIKDKNTIKLLYFSDTHYNATSPKNRKDNLLETSLLKTNEILKVSRDENVDAVIHGGDFFEKPDVTDLVAGRVAEIIKSFEVPFFVVPGGHDLYGNNIETVQRTKIGLFAQSGLVELLSHFSNEYVIMENNKLSVQLTGTASHFGIDYENIDKDYILNYKNADFAVHTIHGMLMSKPFMPGTPFVLIDDILDTKADITLAGHYHLGFDPVYKNNKWFINSGAVVRKQNEIKEIERTPQITIVEISAEDGIKHKTVPLKTAQPGNEILDRAEIIKRQNREIKTESFLNMLNQTQNLRTPNIRTIINEIASNKNLSPKVIETALDRISKMQEMIERR